jgi:hypothetical protein
LYKFKHKTYSLQGFYEENIILFMKEKNIPGFDKPQPSFQETLRGQKNYVGNKASCFLVPSPREGCGRIA